MNTRWLGILGVCGGGALTAIEVRHFLTGVLLNGANIDRLDNLLYAVWGLGMICVMWALYDLDVTGKRPLLRAVPFVPMVGFILMFIGSLIEGLGFVAPAVDALAGIAWLLIALGTLLVSILALVERTWTGWRKFTPLLCILAIPTLLLLSTAISHLADPIFGLSWIVLGFAVMTSQYEAPMVRPAQTAV